MLCKRCRTREVGSDQHHVTFPLCDKCQDEHPVKYTNRDAMLNVKFVTLKGKLGFIQQTFNGKLATETE